MKKKQSDPGTLLIGGCEDGEEEGEKENKLGMERIILKHGCCVYQEGGEKGPREREMF